MLTKPHRLTKKKEFERVFKKGKGFKEDFLFLRFVQNNAKKSRFAIVVSRKVSKNASTRNKIKRRIRAIIGQKIPKLKKGVDSVLVALPGLGTKDFWEVEATINQLFKKSKLFSHVKKNNS